MTSVNRVRGEARQPHDRDEDGVCKGTPRDVTPNVALNRRGMEALALELQLLAASCGLNVEKIEVVTSRAVGKSRRSS